jgi:hypothetical protein
MWVHLIPAPTRKVEYNGLYIVFYNDNDSPRRENVIQRTFQAIADSYCEANNLDLSPEVNAGRGPVDFKFSRGTKKVIVELKRSSNTRVLHGYQVQLAIYEEAEKCPRSVYVVMDQDRDSAVEKVVEYRAEAIRQKRRARTSRNQNVATRLRQPRMIIWA